MKQCPAFIRADLGYWGANSLHLNTGDPSSYYSSNSYNAPYWTIDNPINNYGRLAGSTTPAINYYQSRSFVRLQDLSIAYNVPGPILSKYSIQRLKLFLSFRNILTYTPWDNFDPESGTYPMPKTSSIGINVSF